MKQTIIVIICIIGVILSVFYLKYTEYQEEQNSIKKNNLEYETYLNKQIDGRGLTTVINRAVNDNEENSVQKDEKGFYIENDVNSIKIDIKMIDVEKDFQMEAIYNNGMDFFVELYNSIYFECTRNRI